MDTKNSVYKLKFLVRTHVRSYKYAARGLLTIFLQQLNFQLETIATVIVVAAGLFFGITKVEWIIIIFVIFMVLISEALNSAIEAVCDTVTPERNQDIRFAKDVAAGAVLLAAIASVVIGVLIFLPYIRDYVS